MRWPRRKTNPFAGRDFLDLVPARAVAHAPGGEGETVVLLLPRFRDPVGQRLLQPRLPASRRWIRVALDPRGAAVWATVDGRRTIRDVVPLCEAAFGDEEAELAERLCRWFYAAYENGIIKFLNL